MNLSPQVKASITLPFIVFSFGGLFYLLLIYPSIVIFLSRVILFLSFLGILGAIWYGLYRFFGGED